LDLGRLRGLHYDGLGAPRDDADAARLYRIAALQGHAEDLRLRLEREMTPGQRDEARRLAGEAADR
jgi:TPR repeat protein